MSGDLLTSLSPGPGLRAMSEHQTCTFCNRTGPDVRPHRELVAGVYLIVPSCDNAAWCGERIGARRAMEARTR